MFSYVFLSAGAVKDGYGNSLGGRSALPFRPREFALDQDIRNDGYQSVKMEWRNA